MCNYSNSCTGCSGCGNSWWNCGCQRLCRDACGNICVNQCNGGCSCGCNSNCCCHNGSVDENNGNGGVTCLSYCGNTATGTGNGASTANDLYYARQYGLLPNGSCPCSAGYNYDYATISQNT